MTLKDALMKVMKEKEDTPVGAVADTWLLVGVATHNPHAMVTAHWLNQQGIWIRTPGDVEDEYHRFYEATDPTVSLDSEGVPKAPVSLEKILQKTAVSLAERGFTEQDSTVLSNQKLSWTDKRVALEARIVAEIHGHCYLITNDTELIGRSHERFGRVIEEQGLKITVVMPSYIEQHLHHLLPQLGFRYMLTSNVLAKLYRLGTESGIMEQKHDGQPYILMQRAQRYAFGKTSINVDVATDVLSTDGPERRVPARTHEYGIPVFIVKTLSREEIENAILSRLEVIPSLKPQARRGVNRKGFVFAALPEDEKYLPLIGRLKNERSNGNSSLSYEQLKWGRLPSRV